MNTPKIVVDWKRLEMPLWRQKEGDINAAYCADTLPKIRTFVHERRLYTNCGGHGCCFSTVATCYPVIPAAEYTGPEVKQKYSHESEAVKYKGKDYRLGPKIEFVAGDPTPAEAQRHLRVIYADGGHFVHNKTYAEYLADCQNSTRPIRESWRNAFAAELALCQTHRMPVTQAEMLAHLDNPRSPFPIRNANPNPVVVPSWKTRLIGSRPLRPGVAGPAILTLSSI